MDCSLPGSSSLGDLPDPEIKLRSPTLQALFYPLSHQGLIASRIHLSYRSSSELSEDFKLETEREGHEQKATVFRRTL